MSFLLQIKNLETILHTDTEPVRAVDGLALNIFKGETFALLGESGCGKSMTALSIMRLLPDTGEIVAGEIKLGNEDLLLLPEIDMRTIRGKRISMIFQEPMLSLNPVMTIAEQIGEVLQRHFNLRGAAVSARILEILNQVGIPDAARRMNDYPFQFSGGMKQRVMIAIALAGEPELLIADEPTTALDVTIQAQVLDLMRDLQQASGMAILLITHDLGVVAEMAHRVAVMYAGEVIETATREVFFHNPAHPYSKKLFASLPGKSRRDQGLAVINGNVPSLSQEFTGCRFADRCDQAWDHCHQTIPTWYELPGNHYVKCHLFSIDEKARTRSSIGAGTQTIAEQPFYSAPDSQAADLLLVTNLKVHFPIRKGLMKRIVGNVMAVDGVSLTIAQGRTLALVGESGCGKTTVGKSILQLIKPTAGSVSFNGLELVGLERKQLRSRRAEFQIIFQDPYSSLNPRMRIIDIIKEGINALNSPVDEIALDKLLQQVGLPPETKWRYPHEFSGGQRQRIAIARALAVNPKLLICDEPTSALDVSVQAQILNLLKSLQNSLGLAYLFITHNLSVVEYIADDVAVMYLGRIVERGKVDDVLRNPKHPYTQALLSAVPEVDVKDKRTIIRLKGDLPSPAAPPSGCHFHTRCPYVMPVCRQTYPKTTIFQPTHTAQCYLYSQAQDSSYHDN
ncbi:MAG: ABC transporter ATP-binding protein [Nitrosomonas sp.]|nr:ABC transporter ATP-binding protein [Nitrosomonas sp.]MDP1951740.1 ABC transporter ATP-binding protein [Nitrosomonas sp.]